jgi:hypothetical protein
MTDEVLMGQEGDKCTEEGCTGHLVIAYQGGCTCFISPPCNSCVDAQLECSECGESYLWIS